MPVSSLIFVVIVAIWAAYLVQHWMRRREDDAANRSAEGFTEAMRVLEKRPAPPTTEVRPARPHAHVANGGRSAVEAQHAIPAGRRPSPLVARRADEHVAELVEETVAEHVETVQRPAPVRSRVSRLQRRLRGVVLLASLLWIPTSVALAATGVLLWVSVPFAVLTVVAVLFWLRTEARADRIRAAASRRVRRVREVRRSRSAARSVPAAPVLSSEDTQVIHSTAREVAVSAGSAVVEAVPVDAVAADATVTAAHAEVVFDVQAMATGPLPVAEAPEEEPAPGSWSPVPVPKPTYALKAKAEPRYTEGGIPADVFDTPEFADEAEELDDRALFARRAASQ